MRATGSGSTAVSAASWTSTMAVLISGRRGAALALVMQVQVAEIDDQAEPLAENEDRVVAVNGIDGQHQAAKDAEIPEGHRHDDLLGLFARPPLDDETHHEQPLATEANGDPDQRLPVLVEKTGEHQRYSSPIDSRTSRIVSRAYSRAFSQPSAMMFLTSVGSSRYICARSRIGICSFRMPLITGCLHSMQPIQAVLQPCCTHSLVLSPE